MGNIYTIARHTVREAVRMRVVLAFALLILAIVVGMPIGVYREDAQVSAMVQTFLSWTLMPIGVVLSFLAIFLGCLSISDEMIKRQIYMLVSKPIPRWKYVVGKWLGVVFVLTGLLVFSGMAVYGVAQVLAMRPSKDPLDPWTLKHQIMTARGNVKQHMPDLTADVERMFQRMVEEGRFTTPMNSADYPLQVQQTKGQLHAELMAFARMLGPGENRVFEFRNIMITEKQRNSFDVQVGDVPRSEREAFIEFMVENTPHSAEAVARMLESLPQVVGRELPWEEAKSLNEGLIRSGAVSGILPSTVLQLRYKAKGMGYLSDETLVTAWHFGPTPQLAAQARPVYRKDVKDRYHVVPFPASAVTADGRVFAVVRNLEGQRSDRNEDQRGATLSFESGAMEVLFVIGTFEGNLARTLFLIWCRVTLLAGVGVFAATFLSFPVACLVVFLFYVLAASGTYVTKAMEFGAPGEGTLGPAQYVVQPVLEGLFWMMPKFSEYDGVETFVDGRNVSLMWDLIAFGKLSLFLTTLVLLIGCVIFQRRQVAELSV